MTNAFDRDAVRVPRHDVGPLDDWRSSFDNVLRRREVVLTREPLPSDGTELLDCDVELVCLGALFDDRRAELPGFAAEGSAAAEAATLCQSEKEGSVVLSEPDRPARVIPVGPAGMNPTTWRDGLMLACVARDAEAQSVLTARDRIATCQLPPDRQDAFWLPYCLALASAVTDSTDFDVDEGEARRLMGETSIVVEDVLSDIDRPLLDLASALRANDRGIWDEQVARALRAHRAYYEAPERRFDRRGFVSIGILGLCAAAVERGLRTRVESPYIPADLLRGEHRAVPRRVVYQFLPRQLMRDQEANWFLDLAGFPRSSRNHRIGEVDGRLIARYEADGAPGLPHARVDFVLDASPLSESLPQALDAGQLLALARHMATRAGDAQLSDAERRAALTEAVECVDSVLARIPVGEIAVPADSIRSELGRAEFNAEPARFQRDRLHAYRDSLAELLTPARSLALGAIEVIVADVTPILEALARDRTGETAQMLAPRNADYAAVFVGDAIDVARRFYEDLWNGSLKLQYPSAEQTSLLVSVAPAGMFTSDNELSRRFPGGYRAIASWLNPHRTWVRWKYVRPGETIGLAYDGLVWCDEHWAWFPKPFGALAPLAAAPPT